MIVRDPIYQQLNKELRGLIRGGDFTEGDKFLTERQVSDQFDVSRATANKALASLVSEGTLEFRKGVGTFVRQVALDYDLHALVSFTEKAKAAGKKPSTDMLTFVTVSADALPESAADRFHSELSFYFMERLRRADGQPVILERRWLDAAACPELKRSDLKGSIYSLLSKRFKLEIEGAEQLIRAINLNKADAKVMEAPFRAAALMVAATAYLADGAPLWHEETLYRGDAYEFHNRFGGIRPTQPAAGILR